MTNIKNGLHQTHTNNLPQAGQEPSKTISNFAITRASRHKPRDSVADHVLMDISIPRMSGLAVTELSRKGKTIIKVMVLSVHSKQKREPFFSEAIARAAVNHFASSHRKKETFARLTNRERQVLALIAGGHTNKEIAQQLGIGVRTIETHRERLMRRLDVHSVAGLTRFAIAHGLVSLEQSSRSPEKL